MLSTNLISNLFGQSPLRPIQKHMSKVCACVEQLSPFVNYTIQDDWKNANLVQHEIVKLEHEADQLKREIRRNLPTKLFLPVSRGDVLGILRLQDNLANQSKDIAGIILGRKMKLPEIIQANYLEFLSRCIDACSQARKAILELDELFETGFETKEMALVEEMITKLDNIENDTDEQQIKIRSQIFANEKDWLPIDTMFLYQIITGTGKLADQAQNVGEQLQQMLAS